MRTGLFLFGQLRDEDVAWLRLNGEVQVLSSGDVLIEQGIWVDAVFIVLHGTLRVSTIASRLIATVAAGEILGDVSFVDSRPPRATVRAAAAAAVLRITKQHLSERLETHPLFAARFYRALALFLADRLRATEPATAAAASGAAADPAGGPMGGEVDPLVLDELTQAGARFDTMVRALIQAPQA